MDTEFLRYRVFVDRFTTYYINSFTTSSYPDVKSNIRLISGTGFFPFLLTRTDPFFFTVEVRFYHIFLI